MRPLQKQIIETLHVQPAIDPEKEIRKRVDFLKDYALKSKAKGFVLGLSLGQDSTLGGKLAQMAVDELNEGKNEDTRFIAYRLPHGKQMDESDAEAVIDFIRPDVLYTFDIEPTVRQFKESFDASNSESLGDFHKGNTKARIRMVAQYAFAGEYHMLVIGTDHAAEAVTGFYTKYGDGAADILPLTGLTKRQGKALLQTLGCPKALYEKAPTADLLDKKPLQSDEDELGLSYENIDDYLEGKDVDDEIAEKIEHRFLITRHKRELPVSMFDDWWV